MARENVERIGFIEKRMWRDDLQLRSERRNGEGAFLKAGRIRGNLKSVRERDRIKEFEERS